VTVSLNRDRKRVWWKLDSLIARKSFDLLSAEVWSCLATATKPMGLYDPNWYDTYGWAEHRLNAFAVGLVADWLEEFGAEVPIEAVSNTDAPTVAEVVAALRAKYAELTGAK
jgi:hypothetical protein